MVWCTCQLIYLHILSILLFRDGRLQQATETEIQDRSRVVIQVGNELTLSDINSATHRRLGDDKTLVTVTFFFRQFFSILRVETTLCSETRSEVNMIVQAGNTTCLPDPRPWFRTGIEDPLRQSFVCLTNTTSVMLRCRGPLVIRHLRIFTSQVCPRHWYDPPRCRRSCSDRCQNTPCDQWTGACLPACPDGFHGYDCERPCRCKDPREACDDVTGYCRSGCTPGYDPATFCGELCKNLTWGPGCSRRCNCIFNTPCNPVTGVCPHGCQAGFQWFHGKCQMKCEEGRYGRDCRETCGFCLITCDGDTGDCVSGQCKAGYCGRRCDVKVTQSGCPKTCGKCFAQSCLAPLEECTRGCQPGFYGISCEAACPEVYKGLNCSQGCGRCPGTTRLRRQKQNSTICPSGQTGNLCQKRIPIACPSNMWGADCINKCPALCPCGCGSLTGECLKNCSLSDAPLPKVTTQNDMGWIWALVILLSLIAGISVVFYFIERRKLAKRRAETAQLSFNETIQMPALEPYCTQKGQSSDDANVGFAKKTMHSHDDNASVSIPAVASASVAGTEVDGVLDTQTEGQSVGILRKSRQTALTVHNSRPRVLSVHFSPSVMSNTSKSSENSSESVNDVQVKTPTAVQIKSLKPK